MDSKILIKGGAIMRMKINLAISKLPIAYNTLFMSAIKEAIKASDKTYYEKLYFYEGKNNKVTKNMTFSVGIKDYEIKGNEFEVKGKVSLTISTPDLELGLMIYNGMIKKRKFIYKEYEWIRLRVDLIKEKEIGGQQALFKTLSPICIKNKRGAFMDIEDPDYVQELNYITNEVLKNYRGYGLKEQLDFQVRNIKKIIVKESIRGFQEKTGRQYQCVNAYRGSFVIRGHKEDLNDIYKLGIGFRRAQGFGNLELIEWR